MRKRNRITALMAAVGAALVLAACGGTGGTADDINGAPSLTVPTTSVATPPKTTTKASTSLTTATTDTTSTVSATTGGTSAGNTGNTGTAGTTQTTQTTKTTPPVSSRTGGGGITG